MFNCKVIVILWAIQLMPAVAWAQLMDYEARERLEAAVAGLAVPAVSGTLADDTRAIMSQIGMRWNRPVFGDVAEIPFVLKAGAVIEMVDIRLLLAQIAIQTGARDHNALVRAQGDRDRNVILLRGGFVTLADLWTLTRGTPAQDFVVKTDDGIVLTRPLAIWSDAGLTLDASDQLKLDRPNGSFIVNLGWLDVSGGTIVGSDDANQDEPLFRPFILTAGQGGFTAQAATFRALGFGASPVFSGIAVVNSGLRAPHLKSFITTSTVDDVTTLAVIDTVDTIISGNHIAGSSGPAITVFRTKGSVLAGNTLSGLMGPQAIRVTAGSSDVQISGNLLDGAARMGILIDGDSQNIRIEGNLVTGSLTTAIGVQEVTCISIVDNLVAANGGTAINLTDTDNISVTDNAVLFNAGSGVFLRDQASTAMAHITGNVLIGNRDGLRGATAGNLTLEGNDLDGQFPQVFAGDLAPMTVQWLRERQQPQPVGVHAPGIAPCALAGNG